MTAIYFSLSTDNPMPAPKICFYPANFAANDEVIGQGVDEWLQKYAWNQRGKSMTDRVQDVFTHQGLHEKKGSFTFLGLGRKEDPTKKELSMQIYVTGELYSTPRPGPKYDTQCSIGYIHIKLVHRTKKRTFTTIS
jgi:hypothetical protein